MSEFYKDKTVVCSGSRGMIGKELVELLKKAGAKVREADIQIGRDLTRMSNCLQICEKADIVFHLCGVTGSPVRTRERPVDFLKIMLPCDTNMILAAQEKKVKHFLYTSSITVLNPEVDYYPAKAKSTGEALCSAMNFQYPDGTKYYIVRPTNCFGRFARFHDPNMMVITSLIRKSIQDRQIEVWGSGEESRDFLNARDCARAMMLVMERQPKEAINLGTGEQHTIKEVAEIIGRLSNKKVVFRPLEAQGNKLRPMDVTKLMDLGFKPSMTLESGIQEAYNYAKENEFLKNV